MIVLDRVSKSIHVHGQKRQILTRTSLTIPGHTRIALLGPSQGDNLALIDLIAGNLQPDSGRILRSGRVSFPLTQLSAFAADLSVRKNVAYIARVYEVDVAATVRFVQDALEIGDSFDRPFNKLPNPVRQQLAQIVAYSIPFDIYLLTRPVARNGNAVDAIVYALFEARAKTAGIIATGKNIKFLRDHCDVALLLKEGGLTLIDDFGQIATAADATSSCEE